MSVSRFRSLLALVACVLTGSIFAPAMAVDAPGGDRLRGGVGGAAVAPASRPQPAASLPLGSDDKLTVLLLGSDYRPGYRYPEHTDVMMVASFDPGSKRVVFASIPRDVVFFPRAPRNRVGGLGSTSGVERVNTMYRDDYKRRPAPAAVDRQALLRFKDDVAFALDVEIDRYAYIRFSGFDAMIDGIGGLRVDVDASVFDDVYSDRAGYRGIYIPAGRDYRLGGWSNVENCRPYPMRCHRAIVFVRSRKGREGNGGNSDYRRIRRQQELVFSAISKVSRFDDPTLLALLPLGEQHVTTDLWQKGDTETVRLLRDALGGAVAGRRVVFGPSRYASSGGDLPLYSSVLRLSAVRGWIERHMTTADD